MSTSTSGEQGNALVNGTRGCKRNGAWLTVVEYEIRVSGLVPESVLIEIEGARVVIEPVQTIIRGPVLDQAALHGIVNRLQHAGLDLIEVRQLTVGFGLEQDCQDPPTQ